MQKHQSYVRFPLVNTYLLINNKTTIVGFLFLILGMLCTLKYIFSAGGIIIFMEDVENARIISRKGNGLIIQLAINFFTYGLLTILMIKSTTSFKALFIIIVCFFVLSFGNRGPALFLTVFALYIYQSVNKVEFSLKKITTYGLVIFCLMVLFGALRTNYDADLLALFKARFAWRPFVNIQNFQFVMDFFPKKHDYLYGYTYIVDLSMLTPGSHPNSGTYLKDLMGLHFDGGSITPSYLGMSYVNFGVAGLIFSPIILGFVSNTFYEIYVARFNLNNPSNLILLILISFNFAAIISSGIMTVLIQNISILTLVHLLFIMLIKLFKKVK
jgi:oligosaccharide repeat unit polymerase